ncbi:hypothetical protein FNO01nite_09620 [Flavobacterium noncentrifugens]|nr:hypothetical protein FNO01nite_09620 [Flavobacterium noncentrifugens]
MPFAGWDGGVLVSERTTRYPFAEELVNDPPAVEEVAVTGAKTVACDGATHADTVTQLTAAIQPARLLLTSDLKRIVIAPLASDDVIVPGLVVP